MAVIVESFEGLAPSANVSLVPPYYHVGLTTPHVFGSGMELFDPLAGLAVVGDFLQGNADFGTTLTAGDVPTGSAYLALDAASGVLQLRFSQKVFSVGATVNTKSGEGPGITAYDKNGNVLSGAEIRSVPFGDWDDNYITLLSRKPIASIAFSGGFVTVDDLTFNTSKPKMVKGTNGNDNLNNETSSKGEYVNCRGGDDIAKARGGDDTIECGKGKDLARGGTGNDTIIVGKGGDNVWGDAGQDSFLFIAMIGITKVRDFSVADDTILLSNDVFAGLPPGVLAAGHFQIGAAASDAADRIIYDQNSGELFFDEDGIGAVAARQFGKLSPGLLLTANDFLIE